MGKTEKIFARYFERNRLFFQPDFPDGTNAVVVIPMLDDDELYESLACFGSLENKEGHTGIVIVVNHSETAPEEVKERNRPMSFTGASPVLAHSKTRRGMRASSSW